MSVMKEKFLQFDLINQMWYCLLRMQDIVTSIKMQFVSWRRSILRGQRTLKDRQAISSALHPDSS